MARWIADWRPDDETFWRRTGRRIAIKNLVLSITTEHLGFSVWVLWSVVVVSLPKAGFHFSTNQLFWLTALPNLVGAFARLPYTTAVARFGGRNWTTVSGALLLLPLVLLAVAVTDPTTPYWMFALIACTAGVGGGNFASSMANISFFYPERHKGTALGLNAAVGNLGVAMVQLVAPTMLVFAWFGAAQAPRLHLQNEALYLIPFVLVATVLSWAFMDNLRVGQAKLREQTPVLRNSHTWIMSVLYIGTFGSFIGYSFALPLVIRIEFPTEVATQWAWMGAFVGSLARPVGGWLSDRIGGARVTAWTFVGTGLGAVLVLVGLNIHSFGLFLGAFLLLFVTSGAGNGSTYRMIPAIWREQAERAGGTEGAYDRGRKEAAAVIGLAGAIGAFGGFLINRGIATSVNHTRSIAAAMIAFLVFYAVCVALTWFCYLRRPAGTEVESRSLATAGV